ncbi:MAG: cation-translocating P-type ATPase [Holophagaceae bacterium]|nr:cation-translocating P-type ATPase [Holophagaceae bacterium]
MCGGGYAEIQTTLFNGEPLPVPAGPGDPVIAGTLVHGTPITVRVEATGRNTFPPHGRVVAQAQASRPPLQDLADRVSAIFVPTILVLALLTLAGWWFTKGSFAEAWRPAVTVLVVACPCALGLATPLAMSMALGTAARRGMVVKDLASFEALGRLTDLAFDKTGTITKGQPVVQQVQVLGDMSEEDILAIAAALEEDSIHPIARGIRNAAPAIRARRSTSSRPRRADSPVRSGPALPPGQRGIPGHRDSPSGRAPRWWASPRMKSCRGSSTSPTSGGPTCCWSCGPWRTTTSPCTSGAATGRSR